MKIGADDFLASGKTVDDLLARAEPWNGQGPGLYLHDTHDSHATTCDELRLQNEALIEDNISLIRLIETPGLTLNDIRAAVALARATIEKTRRGAIEANGEIIHSQAEITGDWHAIPEPGTPPPAANNDDSKPLLPRDRVGPILSAAATRGVEIRPLSVRRKRKSGAPYKATDWVVSPATSYADALNPWIATAAPKPRKPREKKPEAACPHCGEVHPVVITCGGCGGEIRRKPVASEQPNPARPMSAKIGNIENGRENYPPAPSVRYVRKNREHETPVEPTYLADAPDIDESTSHPRLQPPQRHLTQAVRAENRAVMRDALKATVHTADFGLDAPVLDDAQQVLEYVTAAPPDDARRGLHDLESQLARIAEANGRKPVPKPQSSPTPPGPAESNDDPWMAPYGEPAGEAGWDSWTQ
jgi:hypothetical protein